MRVRFSVQQFNDLSADGWEHFLTFPMLSSLFPFVTLTRLSTAGKPLAQARPVGGARQVQHKKLFRQAYCDGFHLPRGRYSRGDSRRHRNGPGHQCQGNPSSPTTTPHSSTPRHQFVCFYFMFKKYITRFRVI